MLAPTERNSVVLAAYLLVSLQLYFEYFYVPFAELQIDLSLSLQLMPLFCIFRLNDEGNKQVARSLADYQRF